MEVGEAALARRSIAMVERRSNVALDVFMGPVLVGQVTSHPGHVKSACTGNDVVHRKRHPWITYEHLDLNTEKCVLHHLSESLSFSHFLRRLRAEGFDFGSLHPRPMTRRPAGRCWAVVCEGEEVGALWDYEGNFSCMEWQPAEREMFCKHATMMLYEEESSVHFIVCYLQFAKSKSVQHLREMLEGKGFIVRTKLYRVP
jgi:hypothetical protein